MTGTLIKAYHRPVTTPPESYLGLLGGILF